MKRLGTLLTFLFIKSASALAVPLLIDHFTIKENPFAKDEIAISAVDAAGSVREDVTGLFNFSVNGFSQELKFNNGTAFYRHKIDKSTFVYIKHVNDSGTHSSLYYLYKHDGLIAPLYIKWGYLVVIPLAILLIAYLFKRLIILAVILIIGFFVFNHVNGLHIGTFFETVIDGLKNVF